MDEKKCENIGENSKPNYREKIIEIVDKIKNPVILMKIYTVAKTHLEIERKKEHGN